MPAVPAACRRARVYLLKVSLAVVFIVATAQLASLASGLAARMLRASSPSSPSSSSTSPARTCDSCSQFNFSYIIENREFCQRSDVAGGDATATHDAVFLLIVVTSSPRHAGLRAAIRRTWANGSLHHGLAVRTLFVFGRHDNPDVNGALLAEHRAHSDVMQADFRDSYHNLTVKSIVALRWATTHCRQAQYVLKTDDDVFTNPARYVDLLRRRFLPTNAIGGHCRTAGGPSRPRPPSSDAPRLPVYCGGPSYVMSAHAARAVVSVARNIHSVAKEDVFVSGLCRSAAGLDYRQIGGVRAGPAALTPCDLATWVVNVHQVAPPEMARLWGWATDARLPTQCRPFSSTWAFYVACLAAALWALALVYVLRTTGGHLKRVGFLTFKKRLNSDIGEDI